MAFAKLVEALVQLQSFLEAQRSLLDADVLAQISQAQAKSILQQLRDSGCSRCRHVAGCAPSCVTKRGYTLK